MERLSEIPGVVAPILFSIVESVILSLASSKKIVAESPASFEENVEAPLIVDTTF